MAFSLQRLSDMNLFQIETLNASGLEQSKSKAKALINKRKQQQIKVDDIDNSLSVDIDENDLKDLFEQIKEKERQIIQKKVEIDNLSKERVTLHGALMFAESEFGKYAEKTLTALESVI